MAKRRRGKTERPELVTPERWRHGDMERDFRPADGGKAGGIIGVRDRAPLVIDRLYRDGHLGADDAVARRRLAAAQWLLELWPKTGLESRQTGTYEKRGDPSAGVSDAQLWNEGCYHDAMRAVGRCGPLVFMVCCQNVPVSTPKALVELRAGLDLLARHRGIT